VQEWGQWNKAGSNAAATHSYMKWNIAGGLSFTINLLYSTHFINELIVDIKYTELRGK
jgi:hypothetical protein